jgi:hypothetical protein
MGSSGAGAAFQKNDVRKYAPMNMEWRVLSVSWACLEHANRQKTTGTLPSKFEIPDIGLGASSVRWLSLDSGGVVRVCSNALSGTGAVEAAERVKL